MKRIALALALIAAVTASLLLYQEGLRLTGNFHQVVAGQLYRSAPPDAARLARWSRESGIRSVVNLRGSQPGAAWYDEEVAASADLGLVHADFGMSAEQPFTPARAEELLALMASLPKPILIHCHTGADRTGLAAMIYAYRAGGQDEETAESQLSLAYGHVGLPFVSPTFAMDWSWETLEVAFGIEGS